MQSASGPLPIGTKLFIQIPASEVLLATVEPAGLSARNVFRGVIVDLQAMENIVLVEVDAGEKITAEVLPSTVESLHLKPGVEVFVIIKASGIRRV
jgi:molybdate transport system ATP-binding protein